MKLTIITINYNNKEGLRRTIESVVGQSTHNFEYIVIDGGSDDGSLEVIREYDDFITRWVSEPDSGIYHAMNKGISFASGEYCQFINSGDYLASDDVIETMMRELPDCSIFYGNMIKFYPDGSQFMDSGSGQPIRFFRLYTGTINHSPAWIKRSLFDKYGFYDESMEIAADWKFYLTVVGFHNEKVCYIDLPVICFDMTGISTSNPEQGVVERRKVLEEMLPKKILDDYDYYREDLNMIERLNRYPLIKNAVWFAERVLFKLEKWGLLKK